MHQTRLTDHAGQSLIRIRYENAEYPIPTDFRKAPVFAFQVYTTLDLRLDEIDETALQERNRYYLARGDQTNLAWLARFLALSLNNAQKVLPIFDIYARPLPGPLEMVEHQRCEIQYRKARASNPAVLLIPKVVGSFYDERKFGFLLAIDSEAFKRPITSGPHDPRGPMLVKFDRRFPAASSVEIKRRLQADPHRWPCCTEFLEVRPEKLEVEVIRNQCSSLTSDLSWRYSWSYGMPYDEHGQCKSPPLDLVLGEDEIGAGETSPSGGLLLKEESKLDDFVEEQTPGVVTIRSKSLTADEEATIRYLVYVSYLTADHNAGLEIAARRFVIAFIKHLPTPMTLELQFRIPAQPTLSSVLQTAKTDPPTGYERDSGVLTSATRFPSMTVEQMWLDPQTMQLPKRVFPISRSEVSSQNDPRWSSTDRHERFLVILERPNFVERSGGILFLMADGGRRRDLLAAGSARGSELEDFVEMQVWRSAGMREAAERLAMLHRDPL